MRVTPTRPILVGTSILRIYGNRALTASTADGRLHACYTFVIAAMKGWQGKVSARGVFCRYVAASKRLKSADITFNPIGDCIFLSTKEVRYTPRSCPFSHLKPGANGLNAHTRIIYIARYFTKSVIIGLLLPNFPV